MRALGKNVLPQKAHEELKKISFPLVVLECEVRHPFALFVRQLLSKLSLNPLQVSLSLWENILAL